MMQYTNRELKRNKKNYNRMSQEEKLKMSHDFEMISNMDIMDVSKLNSFAINQYINVGNMYAGLGYKGRFLNVLDELNFVATNRKYAREDRGVYVPEDERYRQYLENKTTFDGKRSDNIQVKKMYVNPVQDLSVSTDKKEKGYDKDWSDEQKFGKMIPMNCILFDKQLDKEVLGQFKPATLYKTPVIGGNKLGRIKFTTCVRSSRLGKRFGFAASDQQSAMSLEYTEVLGQYREKCSNRVKFAVSMKKDSHGKIHYETPMYGEYDGPDSEKTETEVSPKTAYGILANMAQYMRANPEGSKLGFFKNTHDFVKSVTGRSYETTRNGKDQTSLKDVAELHNSYNAGSAANKIRNWKLNLAKEQREKN